MLVCQGGVTHNVYDIIDSVRYPGIIVFVVKKVVQSIILYVVPVLSAMYCIYMGIACNIDIPEEEED